MSPTVTSEGPESDSGSSCAAMSPMFLQVAWTHRPGSSGQQQVVTMTYGQQNDHLDEAGHPLEVSICHCKRQRCHHRPVVVFIMQQVRSTAAFWCSFSHTWFWCSFSHTWFWCSFSHTWFWCSFSHTWFWCSFSHTWFWCSFSHTWFWCSFSHTWFWCSFSHTWWFWCSFSHTWFWCSFSHTWQASDSRFGRYLTRRHTTGPASLCAGVLKV